jgi:Fe-S cluster biogenesis protein NfuA
VELTEPSEAVAAVVEKFRRILQADGATVTVVEATSKSLVLSLGLGGVDCEECVMPRAHLEAMLRRDLEREKTGISSVFVADPRERD